MTKSRLRMTAATFLAALSMGVATQSIAPTNAQAMPRECERLALYFDYYMQLANTNMQWYLDGQGAHYRQHALNFRAKADRLERGARNAGCSWAQ